MFNNGLRYFKNTDDLGCQLLQLYYNMRRKLIYKWLKVHRQKKKHNTLISIL